MTGEITLRGRVLPIGGLREKSLAALRAKIYTVVAPEQNAKDLDEIPPHIRRRLSFKFVKHMDEVLKLALKEDPEKSDRGEKVAKSDGNGRATKKGEPENKIAAKPAPRRRALRPESRAERKI